MTRRSADTKAAILAAARARFAAEGYRSASLRAVARDVGVDPALVVRYFGSKPGLFAAAKQHFWQCPGCQAWDSYPARRVEEL